MGRLLTGNGRYNNSNIDYWSKYGLANVNPDPWTRKRHQSGSMLQSGNGETHRNFELLIGAPAGTGFSHVSRDGSAAEWAKVADVQGSLVGHPAIVGTSFNRDFHAVGVDKDKIVRQWAYSQSGKKWSQVSTIEGKSIDGFPGLAQSDGSQLVVVVKHADGTLNEVRRPPFCSLTLFYRKVLMTTVATTTQQHNVDQGQLSHRKQHRPKRSVPRPIQRRTRYLQLPEQLPRQSLHDCHPRRWQTATLLA